MKPKPGAYTACGQNDRNYFVYRNEDCRLNYKTKTRCKCWLSCSPLLGCACFALVLQAGKTVSCHIITFSPPRTRSKPLFSKLNILSLHSLHKFHVFCFVFSHCNRLLPASFSSLLHFNRDLHDYLTRSRFHLHNVSSGINLRLVLKPRLFGTISP